MQVMAEKIWKQDRNMKIIFLSLVPVCLPRIIMLAFLRVFPPPSRPPPFILIVPFVMFFSFS